MQRQVSLYVLVVRRILSELITSRLFGGNGFGFSFCIISIPRILTGGEMTSN